MMTWLRKIYRLSPPPQAEREDATQAHGFIIPIPLCVLCDLCGQIKS